MVADVMPQCIGTGSKPAELRIQCLRELRCIACAASFNDHRTSGIVRLVLPDLAMSSLFRRLRGSASNNTPQHPRAEAVTSQSTNAPAASVQGAPKQSIHASLQILYACNRFVGGFEP